MNQRTIRRKYVIAALLLIAVSAVWLSSPRMTTFENLPLTPAGSDQDAQVLVARMLRVNQPWLQPVSVDATDRLRRNYDESSLREGHTTKKEKLGPYSIGPGCSPPQRVGSWVQTPLHAMLTNSGYAVRMLGKTKWQGKRLIAVNVAFEFPVRCKVGMGGQSGTTFSYSSYPVKDARIWIDPDRAVPVCIRTSAAESTYRFTDDFYKFMGGLAPRAFEWTSPGTFRERQEFQLTNGVWIFRRGNAAWQSPDAGSTAGFFRRLVEHVLSRRYFKQELELIDFHLTLNRGEVDLLKRYPTELTGGDASADRARPWQFTEGDVFRVSRFDFEVGSELRIETGPVDLGIGHCVDGAVWAVLIPGDQGTLIRRGSPQEAIAHVWLRFHPQAINRLFPSQTVFPEGQTNLVSQIRRIAGAKFTSSWHAGSRATIPGRKDVTVDVDTKDGPRRFFSVEVGAQTANYVGVFENRPVKKLSPLTAAAVARGIRSTMGSLRPRLRHVCVASRSGLGQGA